MEPHELRGRRILVTGAASGIGLATARLAAQAGAQVALLDHDAAALDAACAATGGTPALADLRDADATRSAVASAAAGLGGIDAVINCAGVSVVCPVEELAAEQWDRALAINLTAPLVVVQAALPWLRRSEAAAIVNVSSGMGLLPNAPGMAAYAASKGGLIALTKALAAELAPKIRVNAVCPGLTDTPMTAGVTHDAAALSAAKGQYALGRHAAPEEIARMILVLASSTASFVTGATLAVDGGRTFH